MYLCDEVQDQDMIEDSEQISLIKSEKDADNYIFSGSVKSESNDVDNVKLYSAGLNGFSHRITIGTPDQKFVVRVSTYNSMLWIPHANCTISRNKFNPSKSSTFVKSDQKWTLRTGTSGLLGGDIVKVGGGDEIQLIVIKGVLGMATNIPTGSLEGGFDGELGLGVAPEVPNLKAFIYQTTGEIPLATAMFTIFLQPLQARIGYPDGFITYGWLDKKNCGQVIGVHQFSSKTQYQYKISGISMGNVKFNFQYEVTQDLGPFIMGPEMIIKQFANVAGAHYVNGFYEIGCGARFPDLEINIGSSKYSISSDKLIIQMNNKCIFAMNTLYGGLQWSFGAPFNRQYCVVFDLAKAQIAFAATRTNLTTIRPPTTSPRATTKKMSPSPFQISMALIGLTLFCRF